MKIRHFDNFDIDDDYNEIEIILNGNSVELDVNSGEVIGKTHWVAEYEKYCDQMEKIKKDIVEYIRKDFEEEGTAKEWIDFHIDELDGEAMEETLAAADKTLSKDRQALSLLRLRRIGIYPRDGVYAVWDFVLNDEISDEILTLQTDADGVILNIGWES